jgi:hypothetical protein
MKRIQEGDLVRFNVWDSCPQDYGDGMDQETLDAYDGQVATVTSIEIKEDCDEFSYFDIQFSDGTTFGAISGTQLSQK